MRGVKESDLRRRFSWIKRYAALAKNGRGRGEKERLGFGVWRVEWYNQWWLKKLRVGLLFFMVKNCEVIREWLALGLEFGAGWVYLSILLLLSGWLGLCCDVQGKGARERERERKRRQRQRWGSLRDKKKQKRSNHFGYYTCFAFSSPHFHAIHHNTSMHVYAYNMTWHAYT